MGLCCSSSGDSSLAIVAGSSESRKNANINKIQDAARRQDYGQLKILLLGPGDSGKSTMMKQMRVLFGDGLPESARKSYIPTLFSNLKSDTAAVIAACSKLFPPGLTDPASLEAVKAIQASENRKIMEPEVAKGIITLWKDPLYQKTWRRRNEYQVIESYEDLSKKLKDYPKWGGEEWIPSIRDVMLARVRSAGITQHELKIDKVPVKVMDVGGQRSERQKWIHSFEGVTAIIYIVAISEYDQFLFEDRTSNRLVESLDLFKEVVASQWFRQSRIILFLNKTDLFREKYCVQKVPLNVSGHFPTAPDDPYFDYNIGVKWFNDIFQSIARACGRPDMYVHFTHALDCEYMNVVFTACKDAILQHNLIESGLLGEGEMLTVKMPYKPLGQSGKKTSWIPKRKKT